MWGSLKYMPVGLASTIFFTMPIWVVLIAYFLLKESITKYDILTLVTTFAGVVLINNPFEPQKEDAETNYLYGTIYALTGSLGGAAALICMRVMRKNIHYSISPFWFASGCAFWSPIVHMI